MYNTGGGMSRGSDGLPYLGVSYANGPGHEEHQGPNNTRRDLTNEPKSTYGNLLTYNYFLANSSECDGLPEMRACSYGYGPIVHLLDSPPTQ